MFFLGVAICLLVVYVCKRKKTTTKRTEMVTGITSNNSNMVQMSGNSVMYPAQQSSGMVLQSTQM